MRSQSFPSLSIVIVTKNVERTFERLLETLREQSYPRNKLNVIVVDGGSTDKTLEIIKKSKLNIKVYQGKKPNDPEACKGEGLTYAKGEIVGLIDSDNYLPHKNWLKKMIVPLTENRNLVGSYTWRFAYSKKDEPLNRYFSLIGSADPVGLYLGKADKLSYISEKWIGFGKVIKNFEDYFIVQFDEKHFPTLGSNGFFARRKFIMKGKSSPNKFFHIDVPFDILEFNLNQYAVVKDVIIHDTAATFLSFLRKRIKYMKLHYEKRSKDRRYKVFDPESKRDVFRLTIFIIFSITFIQPLYVSIRGYMKINDPAWFFHPIFCFSIALAYSVAIIEKYTRLNKL
jgi:glycosyltransferase involved in cell wall biosynthesis